MITLPAPKCIELQSAEFETSGTTATAPESIELHRDHDLDQARDHGTTDRGPRIAQLAEAVLVAISAGDSASFAMSEALATAVLDEPIFREAIAVRTLVRDRSPFALVRAVELAKSLLPEGEPFASTGIHETTGEARRRRPGQ